MVLVESQARAIRLLALVDVAGVDRDVAGGRNDW